MNDKFLSDTTLRSEAVVWDESLIQVAFYLMYACHLSSEINYLR